MAGRIRDVSPALVVDFDVAGIDADMMIFTRCKPFHKAVDRHAVPAFLRMAEPVGLDSFIEMFRFGKTSSRKPFVPSLGITLRILDIVFPPQMGKEPLPGFARHFRIHDLARVVVKGVLVALSSASSWVGMSCSGLVLRWGIARTLPSRPTRGSTDPCGSVDLRARWTVPRPTPISAAIARSDFLGLAAIALAARSPAGM